MFPNGRAKYSYTVWSIWTIANATAEITTENAMKSYSIRPVYIKMISTRTYVSRKTNFQLTELTKRFGRLEIFIQTRA